VREESIRDNPARPVLAQPLDVSAVAAADVDHTSDPPHTAQLFGDDAR